MVAARFYDRQARERMQVRKGDQPGASPVNLPGLSDARDAAGKEFGVSGKSVDHATKVLEVLPRARGGRTYALRCVFDASWVLPCARVGIP